jgi:YD repeat-containing protein
MKTKLLLLLFVVFLVTPFCVADESTKLFYHDDPLGRIWKSFPLATYGADDEFLECGLEGAICTEFEYGFVQAEEFNRIRNGHFDDWYDDDFYGYVPRFWQQSGWCEVNQEFTNAGDSYVDLVIPGGSSTANLYQFSPHSNTFIPNKRYTVTWQAKSNEGYWELYISYANDQGDQIAVSRTGDNSNWGTFQESFDVGTYDTSDPDDPTFLDFYIELTVNGVEEETSSASFNDIIIVSEDHYFGGDGYSYSTVVDAGTWKWNVEGDASNEFERQYVTSKTDKFGNVVEVRKDSSSIGVPSHINTFEYDILGNLLIVRDSYNRADTENIYNTLGQVVETSSIDGGTYNFDYDDNGNLERVNSNNCIKIQNTYDSLNRLRNVEYSCNQDDCSGLDLSYCEKILENTANIHYFYGKGEDESPCRAEGSVGYLCDIVGETTIRYTYGLRGNVETVVEVIDESEYTSEYTYDDIGNIKTISTSVDEDLVEYEYNKLNKLNRIIINGEEVDYEYGSSNDDGDKVGSLKSIEYPNDLSFNYAYNHRGFISDLELNNNLFDESYEYDYVGNLFHIKDEVMSRDVSFNYDGFYRLMVIDNDDDGSPGGYYDDDNDLSSVHYFYDDGTQNRNSRKASYGPGGDGFGRIPITTNYYYERDVEDEFMISNRLIYENITSLGITREYSYDALGNVIWVEDDITDDVETGVRYWYDANNMLKKVIRGDKVLEFTYDPLGRRVKKENVNGVNDMEDTNYVYGLGSTPLMTIGFEAGGPWGPNPTPTSTPDESGDVGDIPSS